MNKEDYPTFQTEEELKFDELVEIEDFCYESFPCKHYIIYKDTDGKTVRARVCSSTIWNIVEKRGFPLGPVNDKIPYYEHFLEQFDFESDELKQKVNEYYDNLTFGIKTDSDVDTMHTLLNKDPQVITSLRIVTRHTKHNLRWLKMGSVNSDNRFTLNLYCEGRMLRIKAVKLLNKNGRPIHFDFDTVELMVNSIMIMRWYGDAMLNGESMELRHMIPIIETDAIVEVRVKCGKEELGSVYILTVEDQDSYDKIFENKRDTIQFVTYVYEELCTVDDTEHHFIEKASGYYTDFRCVVYDKDNGKKVVPSSVLGSITLTSDKECWYVANDLPVGIFEQDDILFIEPCLGVFIYEAVAGIPMSSQSSIQFDRVDGNCEVKLYGRKAVCNTVTIPV